MLAALTRVFVDTVQRFYTERPAPHGGRAARTGAVTVVQRTSSDLRLNPHLHVVFLDGAYHEQGTELASAQREHLGSRHVGQVLERAVARMVTLLRRRGALDEEDGDEHALEASAVSGHTPPAGPQWLRGLSPLEPRALHYDKPLCASLDGFTLHAATRAGAADTAGREALLRYVLRPPIAEERIEPGHGGLVRIALERAFADGTIAVEMDPLSLLCRLAASVPPPRYHLVEAELEEAQPADRPRPTYRAWADLLRRTFQVDVLECPTCKGRMKLLAVVTHLGSVRRYLAAAGETTDLPGRSPSRGPPCWKSTVLRRKALEVAWRPRNSGRTHPCARPGGAVAGRARNRRVLRAGSLVHGS